MLVWFPGNWRNGNLKNWRYPREKNQRGRKKSPRWQEKRRRSCSEKSSTKGKNTTVGFFFFAKKRGVGKTGHQKGGGENKISWEKICVLGEGGGKGQTADRGLGKRKRERARRKTGPTASKRHNQTAENGLRIIRNHRGEKPGHLGD